MGLAAAGSCACNCCVRWQRRSGLLSLLPLQSQLEDFLFEILYMLLLENSWIGTGCKNYRFKNIPSHKDGTNTGPPLNAPWLPEIWSGSEIQTAAVCGEKDSPPLSGGKEVKLLCIMYVLRRAFRGLVSKFAWTCKISFLMPGLGRDELTVAVELLMGWEFCIQAE